MCAKFLLCIIHNILIPLYCTVVDLDLPPEDIELGRIAKEIGDIWIEVGLELGLPLNELKTIEADNPGRNAMAALDMLSTWKDMNKMFHEEQFIKQ